MKTELKNLLCVLALTGASATFAADYPNAILADGPLAYYRFGENVVTPTFDTIVNSGTLGAAVNGIYSGSVTHPVAGILPANGAASANGTILSVAYNAGLNPVGAFTIEGWLRPTVTNAPTVLTCALSSMHAASPRTGWLLYQSDTGWNFRMYNGVDANTTISITGGSAPVAGNWYHVVVSFDGTTATMYVNGVAGPSAAPAAFVQNSDSAFNIASRSDAAFGWNGTADEVAFYPSALSASEVAAHNAAVTTNAAGYAAQVLASSPAGYWRLDETVPTYAVAANPGSLGAAASGKYISGVTNIAGPSGTAFPGFEVNNTGGSFDGTSGSVQISNLAALNFEGPFTVTAWIKPASQSAGLRNIVSHGYTTTPNGEVMMRRNTAIYEFGTWPSGGGVSAAMPPEDVGIWSFMVGTYDGVNLKLYRNGAEVASVLHALGSVLVNAAWGIGSRGGEIGSDGRFFDGEIDEAAIFNKGMTPGHILSLYFAAIGSNSPPFMVSDPPVVSPLGTIYATTPFSITADVAGALPLSYQWRHAGTNLPGATAQTFSKASAGLSDAGDYDLVTTNNFGAVTSLVATVTVDPAIPPTIDLQPYSRSVYVGAQASFKVAASGTAPIRYQWKHAGTNLPGATNATVYITNCNVAEAGAYTVGVSNVAGGLISSPAAILSLITPAPGSYEERVVGFRPLAYWRLNEGDGTTAFDHMGGYDGTVLGSITLSNAAPASPLFPGFEAGNTSYGFDAVSGSVQVGNPAGLSFTGQITLAAWVKPASRSDGLFNILSHGYTTSPNGEVQLRRQGTIYEVGSWPTGGGVSAGIPPEDGADWAFIVGTYDGLNWRIYHNGIVIGTAVNAAGLVLVNAGWGIGARGDATTDTRIFEGEIDEAMIFNRALTGPEVCALYNRALGYNGSVEPTATLINGSGNNTLTNETFNVTDGGFTFVTPKPSAETDWTYSGTSWGSAGQGAGLGIDNVSYLTSPAYTATRAGVVKLSFNHRHSFEADATLWDGGAVEVSVNGGPFTRVSALAFDQNGYNGVVASAPTLAGQPGFVGNSAGHPAFITSSCVLAGVQIGDTVRVRFVADYDNNTTGNLTPSGWEIDSIQLTEGGSGAVSVACPCGTLQQTSALGTPWVDAGNPVVIETKSGLQRFFRVKP